MVEVGEEVRGGSMIASAIMTLESSAEFPIGLA